MIDIPAGTPFAIFAEHFARHLRARNLTEGSQREYRGTVRLFGVWAAGQGIDDPLRIERHHCEDFLADRSTAIVRGGRKITPETVHKDFRNLRVFFRWLDESEGHPNPMRLVRPPIVPPKDTPSLTDAELSALFATCAGKTFVARRDLLILRLLFDTGIRLSELAGIAVTDIDRVNQVIRVFGKGRKERLVSYGGRTAEALDSYERARMRHANRTDPALLLADITRGKPRYAALGGEGIAQLIKRHARQAGIEGRIHAHRFRHTAADRMKRGGASTDDLMSLFGWESPSMVRRYARAEAQARALDTARRVSHGDKL